YVEEAIQEVQVLTNGISARYGRFQGGVVNATTKTGGNTFDGSARVDVNKQSWNQKSPFGEVQTDKLSSVYSGTFGGPIVKDHLWFFLAGRTIPQQAVSASLVDVGQPVQLSNTRTTDELRYQGKLTGAISANHTIEASYLSYDRTIKNDDPLGAGELIAINK